ncbi:hypothetical protein A9K55_003604 [Cordyceps militaris]|uniref:Zn(2)-C6 fungal-type domain-containing protein n=1 Tax=Cordyceps militaris TaxID=73501 RepID=A0A2H4S7Q8_CORMI|nr:hypothetical protein A9K55_003604 [Cordyceps militaris]
MAAPSAWPKPGQARERIRVHHGPAVIQKRTDFILHRVHSPSLTGLCLCPRPTGAVSTTDPRSTRIFLVCWLFEQEARSLFRCFLWSISGLTAWQPIRRRTQHPLVQPTKSHTTKMDPPISYIWFPGTDREPDCFAPVPVPVQQIAPPPPGAVEDSLPQLTFNFPSWYALPPTTKILSTLPPASSSSQIESYSHDVSQLVSEISAPTCPVHGHHDWLFQPMNFVNVPMETHLHPLSRRVAEFGRLICSCATLDPHDPDGYERLIDGQAGSNADQQYVAEKSSLALATDVRWFPTYHAWETAAGRYSNQNVLRPHEFNGQQPFGPEPLMNASCSPPEQYPFTLEPANPTIPISAFTIARAQTQPEASDAQWAGPRPGKRGPFRDPCLRQETAYTRKIGCCIRCRMQRIRCDKNPDDPDGTCLTCKKVAFAKTGQLPCLRYKIADIALYKSGQVPGFEWTRRWSNELSDPIDTWASTEIRTIRISEGYSASVVELQVRQFVPLEGDKLDRTWDYKGEKKSVRIPPFALVDTQKARKAFAKHIDASINETLKKITKSIKGSSVSVMQRTYLEAFRLAQRTDIAPEVSNILQTTFRLWTSTRLNTISCFIVGDDTLDMPADILDETSPTPGKVPVPPVMGAQLNLIMIHQIQAKLRKSVLDQLQKIVQKNKQSTWLVTYYVDFILLHNASMIIAHDEGYARKHGIKRRFAREDKVTEYHVGANIVLAYFHYCNKGMYPFTDECSDVELRSLAELSEQEIGIVRGMAAYAKLREAEWERLRESREYDHPEYYICQMFEQNWKPRTMIV